MKRERVKITNGWIKATRKVVWWKRRGRGVSERERERQRGKEGKGTSRTARREGRKEGGEREGGRRMESPEAAEGRRGGDEREARWGKEECGYGRSRTSPSRTGPAKPDRDHEKRAKRRPRGPTACARASAPQEDLCSRHSPNGSTVVSVDFHRFPGRVSSKIGAFSLPERCSPFPFFHNLALLLLSSLFFSSFRLFPSSRDLASSTDGILIASRIGRSSEKNELVGTKRSCLKIARDDCFFFFFFSFFCASHRWWWWSKLGRFS